MTSSPVPKVAGIDRPLSALPQTSPPSGITGGPCRPGPGADFRPGEPQERLASWIADLTTLHELTERLGRTRTLGAALRETLRAGAHIAGARRGLISLHSSDVPGPERLTGLGLDRSDLGDLETVPCCSASRARPADAGKPPLGEAAETGHFDIAADHALDPRHREVAARLGFAASYALPLACDGTGRLGAAVWLYDEPARPDARRRNLLGLYLRHAGRHIAHQLELSRARSDLRTVHRGLLPARLPDLPGVSLAARHRPGSAGGNAFYEAMALPEDALGLAVGGVPGEGPAAVASMGRLLAGLRAYAVMEGEDPVAVLSDLELLLRVTEPGRTATALFGYAEPAARSIVVATAGQPPPLLVGPGGAEFVETTLSAPLGMLACWESPSVELDLSDGRTALFYTDGLLHRTGEPMDRAFARLQDAAERAPARVREDPGALADHVLEAVPPGRRDGRPAPGETEDAILLAVRL